MGAWVTRTRAWVYIAFYDEYVGRHINSCAGLSVLFFVPLYMYGLHVNRIVDRNHNHMYYQWTYFDKRNRLTHNLIMEHFEMHKEKLEDLVCDMNEKGPAVFDNLRSYHNHRAPKTQEEFMNDMAIIDELSGITDFIENHMETEAMSETQRDRFRAHLYKYKGKDKLKDLNKIAISLYGDQR